MSNLIISLLLLIAQVQHSHAFQLQRPSIIKIRTRDSTTLLPSAPSDDSLPKDIQSALFDDSLEIDQRYAGPNRDEVFGLDIGLIPAIVPVFAYIMYDPTAAGFAFVIDKIAQNNFVPVDGGQYQAKIIAPAINGVVVPGIT